MTMTNNTPEHRTHIETLFILDESRRYQAACLCGWKGTRGIAYEAAVAEGREHAPPRYSSKFLRDMEN